MTYKRGIINLVPLFLFTKFAPMDDNFEAQCAICGTRYENHTGSTPCCGALAYVVEDGVVTDKATILTLNKEGIKSTTIKVPSNERADTTTRQD